MALSYVWGPPANQSGSASNENPNTNRLLEVVPAVIRDAIDVTRRLGFLYLWVDRYCIPSEHRHLQIGMMDIIYSRSALIIIAAAVDGPDHGLPGVQSCPRDITGCDMHGIIQVGGYSILRWNSISVLKALRRSTWNTRGWTYQEAVLCRRRLIFTPQFAVYEGQCNPGRSFILQRGFVSAIYNVDFSKPNSYFKSMMTPPSTLTTHANDYMRRRFTYESDVYDAFRGIERMLSTEMKGYTIHYGLPTSTGVCEDCTFIDGLLWRVTVDHGRYPQRRKYVPSWTWLGWKLSHARGIVAGEGAGQGPIWPLFEEFSGFTGAKRVCDRFFSTSPAYNLRLAFPDGSILPWKESTLDLFNGRSSSGLPTLMISGWVFDASKLIGLADDQSVSDAVSMPVPGSGLEWVDEKHSLRQQIGDMIPALGVKDLLMAQNSGDLVCLVLAGYNPRGMSRLRRKGLQVLWMLVLYRKPLLDIFERVTLIEVELTRRWETYDVEKELGCTFQELKVG